MTLWNYQLPAVSKHSLSWSNHVKSEPAISKPSLSPFFQQGTGHEVHQWSQQVCVKMCGMVGLNWQQHWIILLSLFTGRKKKKNPVHCIMESHQSNVTLPNCACPPPLPNSWRDWRTGSDVISNKPSWRSLSRGKTCNLIVASTLFRLFNNNTLCHPHQKFFPFEKKNHNNFIYGHKNKNNTSNIYEMFWKNQVNQH